MIKQKQEIELQEAKEEKKGDDGEDESTVKKQDIEQEIEGVRKQIMDKQYVIEEVRKMGTKKNQSALGQSMT